MSERCCTRTYNKGYQDGYARGAKNWYQMMATSSYPHFGRIDPAVVAYTGTFYCLEWWYRGNGR